MLTDIFARRYANYLIWTQYTQNEPRLLTQCMGVAKDVLPYFDPAGKIRDDQKVKWRSIHDQLARELGVRELWQRFFVTTTKWEGVDHQSTYTNEWVSMCEMYVTSPYVPQNHGSIDRFMKERLSVIELAMRLRQYEIDEMNRSLEQRVRDLVKLKGFPNFDLPDGETRMRSVDTLINQTFNASVNELNVRFQQAGAPLSYHNGFIQVAKDEQIEKQVAGPFWSAIADPRWANVATDMNEALDRRDNGAGDAALHACRALESAIKIVSDLKGWSTANEKGAHNYIDNLAKVRNGTRFIETFEMEVLKSYFTQVRNKLGHGAGSQPMLKLTVEQTDWAIEFAMSWVRTLARRT